MIVAFGMSNAFNSVRTTHQHLAVSIPCSAILPTFCWSQGKHKDLFSEEEPRLGSASRVRQGDHLGCWLFSLGLSKLLLKLDEGLTREC